MFGNEGSMFVLWSYGDGVADLGVMVKEELCKKGE